MTTGLQGWLMAGAGAATAGAVTVGALLLWPAPLPAPSPTVSERAAAAPPKAPAAAAPQDPTAAVAPAAVSPSAAPAAAEPAQHAPRFDHVRIEADGSAVIAGRAAPRAKVQLFVDDVAFAETTAGADGQFALLTSLPVSRSQQQLELVVERDGARKTVMLMVEPLPRVAAEASQAAEPPIGAGSVVAALQPGAAEADEPVPGGTEAAEAAIAEGGGPSSADLASRTASAASIDGAGSMAGEGSASISAAPEAAFSVAGGEGEGAAAVDASPSPETSEAAGSAAPVQVEAGPIDFGQSDGGQTDVGQPDAGQIVVADADAEEAQPGPAQAEGDQRESAQTELVQTEFAQTEFAQSTPARSTIDGSTLGGAEPAREYSTALGADPTDVSRSRIDLAAPAEPETIASGEPRAGEAVPEGGGAAATSEAGALIEAPRPAQAVEAPTAPLVAAVAPGTKVGTEVAGALEPEPKMTAGEPARSAAQGGALSVGEAGAALAEAAPRAAANDSASVAGRSGSHPAELAALAEAALPSTDSAPLPGAGAALPGGEEALPSTYPAPQAQVGAALPGGEAALPATDPAPQVQVGAPPLDSGAASPGAEAQIWALAPGFTPAVPPAPAEAARAAPLPQAPRVVLADEEGVRVLQSGEPPSVLSSKVALDSIGYAPDGAVILAGRGAADRFVRVYVDNSEIITAAIGADGQWQTDLPSVDKGVYTLRVDELDAAGAVTSRTETPFLREDAAMVAAELVAGGGDPAKPVTVVVQPGNTLWGIARGAYGKGTLYVRVFEANRGRIRNPHLIYPGQVFDMPQISR